MTSSRLAPAWAMVAGLALAAGLAPTPAQADDALHAMLPEPIREAGVIKLVTDAHYPPCESFAEDNKTMVGFEPDLWNAMAERLKVKIEPSSIDFAGLIPGVHSGRYDVAVECISDSAEREKQVTFVAYAYGSAAIYTMADNAAITDDELSLCGKTTAAQIGTDFLTMLEDRLQPHCKKAGKAPIKVLQYPNADAVLLALYAGRIDFALNDAASVEEVKDKAPRPIKVITSSLIPKLYLGMVVAKDNKALQQALEAAVASLQADGTYDKIMDKWELGPMKLEGTGINLATTKPLKTMAP